MMKIYRVDMLEYPSCILGKYKIVRKNEKYGKSISNIAKHFL